jgi:hypothetical protein
MEQTNTMLKQFWLLTVKRWPHLMHQCAVILAIDCLTNWYGLVKYKSLLAEEYKMHDFQSTVTAVQFSSSLILGHAIQYSVVSIEGQLNVSMTCQLLK